MDRAKNRNVAKIAGGTFFVWLLSTVTVLLFNEIFLENQSREDLMGFLVSAVIYFAVLVFLIYWPLLRLLHRQTRGRLISRYFLLTGFVCNAPFFLFAVLMSGKAFQPSEAGLFCLLFIVTGGAFGFLFSKYTPSHSGSSA